MARITIDGKTERISEFSLLKRKQENDYLAMIFENESYLIVDPHGKPVEY